MTAFNSPSSATSFGGSFALSNSMKDGHMVIADQIKAAEDFKLTEGSWVDRQRLMQTRGSSVSGLTTVDGCFVDPAPDYIKRLSDIL